MRGYSVLKVVIGVCCGVAAVNDLAAEESRTGVVQRVLQLETIAIPVGGIVLWSGSTTDIPQGFELCDGGDVTTAGATLRWRKPDLRERFVMGAAAGVAAVSDGRYGGANVLPPRKTGGRAITPAQMPAHSHAVVDEGHDHSISTSESLQKAPVAYEEGKRKGAVDWWPGHNSPIRISASKSKSNIQVAQAGEGREHDHDLQAEENRPAYCELFYIIRVR